MRPHVTLFLPKAIAVHTFVVVFWEIEDSRRSPAYFVVGLTWIFLAFFIAMSVSNHTRGSEIYETPVGVSVLFLRFTSIG